MTNLQLKMEVQGAAQNWVASVMQQYGVPASMMEDALTKVLLSIKELVAQEAIQEIIAAQTPIQEKEKEGEGEKKDG